MDILTYVPAKDRIGYGLNDKGYLIMWTSQKKGNYEHIVSWSLFTKSQAVDIIRMVFLLAYILPHPYYVNDLLIYPDQWSEVFSPLYNSRKA